MPNNQSEVHNSLINSKSGITFSEEYKEYNLKSNVHGKPKNKIRRSRRPKVYKIYGSWICI